MQPPGNMIDDLSAVYFFSPSDMARKTLYHPLSAGEFYCNLSYSIDRRSTLTSLHNYLLIYTISGNGALYFEGRTYRASAGDVMLVNCSKPHKYWCENHWHIMWLHYDGPAAGEIFHWIYRHRGCVSIQHNDRVIRRILRRILLSQERFVPIAEPALSLLIQRVLTELLPTAPKSETPVENPYVSKAIAYIQSNMKEKITVKDLASHVNVSVYHFSRLFKYETGFSPYQFITQLRMERAKVLLQTTNYKLKQIVVEVGLQSETSLIRHFQRTTGISPTEFRKKQ